MGWKDDVIREARIRIDRNTADALVGSALTALSQAVSGGTLAERTAAADVILRAFPVVSPQDPDIDVELEDSDDEERHDN